MASSSRRRRGGMSSDYSIRGREVSRSGGRRRRRLAADGMLLGGDGRLAPGRPGGGRLRERREEGRPAPSSRRSDRKEFNRIRRKIQEWVVRSWGGLPADVVAERRRGRRGGRGGPLSALDAGHARPRRHHLSPRPGGAFEKGKGGEKKSGEGVFGARGVERGCWPIRPPEAFRGTKATSTKGPPLFRLRAY